jgi:hypothetical protein
VLDQAVDLVGGELVLATEGAEDVADDLAIDLVALDDVDVLVGLVGMVSAPDLDVHAPPPQPNC